MTCTVVQERDQSRLYDAVSRAVRLGDAFAVLDPTWPQAFLRVAAGQVEAAVSDGTVGQGDMVVFSSGSTGQPRGIVRSVDSWRASVTAFSDITGVTAQDSVWLPGPLWSSLFLFGAFHAGAVGARVILRDDSSDESAGATTVHCVPSQLPALLQRAEVGGLPLVRCVVVAGDHLPATRRKQCKAAGWHVVEYYGAAELSIVAWRSGGGPFRAFPGVETEVRKGVLWARSPYLARGYLAEPAGPGLASPPSLGLADPDRTVPRFSAGAAAPSLGLADLDRTVPRFGGVSSFAGSGSGSGPLLRDPMGWATVSDLARKVPGGLEVVGRGNSAVTSGGHTVVVEEVERLLLGLRGVDEVAVLGAPHPRLGQVLTAVVVGSAVDGTLRAAVAEIPAPSRPRRWLHADALPRTSGGKLRRDALPDLVLRLSQS